LFLSYEELHLVQDGAPTQFVPSVRELLATICMFGGLVVED